MPAEYAAKARNADRNFGGVGCSAVQTALRALPEVRGLAFGAMGEFSSSVDTLIEGFAHEGALKHADRFRQRNYKPAFALIHWWLKRRWGRLAAITAVEVRYAALRYVGGAAQAAAADRHTHQEQEDDWRYGAAFREREADTTAGGFGGFAAGA